MRVLVVKTSSMGDVIHTLPALEDARKAIPKIQFDWVVEEAFAEIPAWHPAVARVIPIAVRRWRKSLFQAITSYEWKEFRTQLARHHYDYIIDAQGLMKSAWITYCAKGPSYGLDRKSIREPLAALFYQHRIHVPKEMHAVERVRQLFATALNYPLPQETGDYGIERSQFLVTQVRPKPYVVFLHGTTRHEKHWPENYWQALAKEITTAGFEVLLPWGSALERERAERIAGNVKDVVVLPSLKLSALAGVIANAHAVVAVDTGLGHLAAALDVPSISLYGPTSPSLVGAYGKQQIHLSAKDYPVEGLEVADPKIFTPLTPQVVLENLQPMLQAPASCTS